MEATFSLKDILKVIKGRLLLIVTFTIVVVGIASFISIYIITPVYQAQTQILINQKNLNENTYTRSQIETDLQIINTYYDIIKTPVILDKVIERLQLNRDLEKLAAQILLYSENESKVIFIEVRDPDPVLAVDIANTTAEVFKNEVPSLMNVDNINILSKAKIHKKVSPVRPNNTINISLSVVFGLMLSIGLAFIMEILDSKIKDEKDVEEILGIPVMGIVSSIPLEKVKNASLQSQRIRGNQDAWIEK